MLSCETITKDVNKIMSSVSKSLINEPNITSRSFRVGSIFQLWKDNEICEIINWSYFKHLDKFKSLLKLLIINNFNNDFTL